MKREELKKICDDASILATEKSTEILKQNITKNKESDLLFFLINYSELLLEEVLSKVLPEIED